ncbi:hypothetical protein [Corynebacterium pacaense]|uniref:hypothetical protein n=1 Tax=Corynebacterium pacaense TaxID=1816684 RepID=UPI0009BC3122|nr:hypothetical protein [Corynebacterium pacaense]
MARGFFNWRRRKNEKHDDTDAPRTTRRQTAGASSPAGPAPYLTPADFLPDEDLPQLNRSRANMLRRELEYRFTLAEAQITFDGNSALILRPDGGSAHVSLRTLALNAAGLDDISELSDLVQSFVHGTLADATLGELSTADLYRSLRLRLLPTPDSDESLEDSNPGIERQIRENSVLRGFTSDTSIALVLDTEHAIRIQPLAELESFDSIDVLERAADRNTWRELSQAEVDANYVSNDEGGPGSDFWAFESTSYYLGSSPLFLPDLLQKWAPELDQSQGVIFAVPDRDLLLARPVTTGEHLMNGITSMVRIAMRFGLGNPTSISPRLHLLHENQVTTFTDFRIIEPEADEEWDGAPYSESAAGAIGIEVRPDPYLMAMLQSGETGNNFGDGFDDFGGEPDPGPLD